MVRYLDTQKETVSHGEIAAIKFWAIPKVNFPKGLPPHVAENLADKLHEFKVDHSQFYVVDQKLDCNKLG